MVNEDLIFVKDDIESCAIGFADAPEAGLVASEALNGYLFTSPRVIGYFVFVIGPMIGLVWLSVHRWDPIGAPRPVGWRNFERLFSDRLILKSLEVTVIYGLGRVPLGIVEALGTALPLNNRRVKFIGIWRTS